MGNVFPSWIEKDGKCFYLTDKEAFSGNKNLEGCSDNDLLGHPAIRLFFYDELGSGAYSGAYEVVEKAAYWFWNPAYAENLPEEIFGKVKDFKTFKKYFGKMFKAECFLICQLKSIIEKAPDAWRKGACDQLWKQDPTKDALLFLIIFGCPSWQQKAWKMLLEQDPSERELCWILERCSSNLWSKRISEEILKRDPGENSLANVSVNGPPYLAKRASKLLYEKIARETQRS